MTLNVIYNFSKQGAVISLINVPNRVSAVTFNWESHGLNTVSGALPHSKANKIMGESIHLFGLLFFVMKMVKDTLKTKWIGTNMCCQLQSRNIRIRLDLQTYNTNCTQVSPFWERAKIFRSGKDWTFCKARHVPSLSPLHPLRTFFSLLTFTYGAASCLCLVKYCFQDGLPEQPPSCQQPSTACHATLRAAALLLLFWCLSSTLQDRSQATGHK